MLLPPIMLKPFRSLFVFHITLPSCFLLPRNSKERLVIRGVGFSGSGSATLSHLPSGCTLVGGPSRRSLMGEREMEVDRSSLLFLAKISELVSEGLLSLSPAAQTRPSTLPRIVWDKMLEMNGQGVKLVLEKRLWATDMNLNQGRLSIPKLQIREKFLSSEETQTLDNTEAITVSLIEPCLEVRHGLQLRKWKYQSGTFSYVLTTQWNAVTRFERNGLQVNSLVQLWSFRVDGDLCFCLVNLEAP